MEATSGRLMAKTWRYPFGFDQRSIMVKTPGAEMHLYPV
jgi:hypothetical protein